MGWTYGAPSGAWGKGLVSGELKAPVAVGPGGKLVSLGPGQCWPGFHVPGHGAGAGAEILCSELESGLWVVGLRAEVGLGEWDQAGF